MIRVYAPGMAKAGAFALAAVIFSVYGLVLLSIFIGAVRAVQERYLPPWVVGLGVTAGVLFLLDGLGDPLGVWGLVLAVVSGMVAGGHYGLSRRRRVAALMPHDSPEQ